MVACVRCQLPYDPVQTPGGHCPRCLLLVSPASGSGDAPAQGWEPPAVADVQALLPDYALVGLIGRGGMGVVYQARQHSLDRTVAIKILPSVTDALGVGYGERFKNEARLLASLNHPGIVHVYDFGELPGQMLYFVMEFVDGTDVARLLAAQGRLEPVQAARIAAEVCAALHCAHQASVVHRDVKPANILLTRDGTVKVADFGLAKRHDPNARDLTTGDLLMGTADFAAPEALVAGSTIDRRADVYAVGVMLYKMLTGEIPRGVFPPASERAPGVSRQFDPIITKALQKDPERRYQSAEAMLRDLEQTIDPRAMRRSRSPRWRSIAAIVTLAAAAAIALLIRAPWRSPAPPAAATVRPARKPIPNAAAQRAIADWVFAKGGKVTLEGETERREGYWTLPKTPFQITEIYFENVAPIGGPVTDADLARYLPQLPALYQFVIVQSPGIAAGISDRGARLLSTYPQICDLGLDGVRLSEATVRQIGAMPKLRTLVLSHSPIHGDALQPSADRLTILSLTYCDIDAAAWKTIGSMSKLELARFPGTPIDSSMIDAIIGLKKLRRLGWLVDPAHTAELDRIKRAHPNLTVRLFQTWNTTEPPPLRLAGP